MLVKEQDIVLTRDALWRALMALEIQTSSRVLSEKLDGAYAGMYGYDPTVHAIYTDATSRMRARFEEAHHALLVNTQQDVISLESAKRPFFSAQLGNRLRESTAMVENIFATYANDALAPLRERMLTIIQASDEEIYTKRLQRSLRSAP